MSNKNGLTSSLLLAMETCAVFVPIELGLKFILKVLELFELIELLGFWIIVKSGLPTIWTKGVPVKLMVLVPIFFTVKVLITGSETIWVSPKSVPLIEEADELWAMVVLFNPRISKWFPVRLPYKLTLSMK